MIESKIPELKSNDYRVSVGRFSYGNPSLFMWKEDDTICIGSFCSIAIEVAIFGGGEHRTDWVSTFPLRIAFDDPMAEKDGHPGSKGHTVIGNDVWIGYRAVILSGVTIGDGAVIGAGSVVASNVPPYAIVAGNPAKVIKYRFTPEIIEKLIDIKWWDWDIEKIKSNVHLICAPNIEEFIKAHGL
jgi:chloramphenicol O-acetyltransferase type B